MMKKYIAVSGGADSTATALLLWERGEDFEMVFSDTGVELPEVYYILPELSKIINKPLHVISGGSFFQYLVQFGYLLPSIQRRWCTRLLKTSPQDKFFKENNVSDVSIGFRADEDRELPQNRPYSYNYPLRDAGFSRLDVHNLCKKYGLLNDAYKWRSRINCWCCFNQSRYEWLGLYRNYPSLYKLAEKWEGNSNGFNFNEKFSLEQLRKADQRQIKILPDKDEGEECLICTI